MSNTITISLTGTKFIASVDSDGVVSISLDPSGAQVTRSVTFDAQTLQTFCQRMATLFGWTAESEDEHGNPIDCALPGIKAFIGYITAEAAIESKRVADLATATAQATAQAASYGQGVIAVN